MKIKKKIKKMHRTFKALCTLNTLFGLLEGGGSEEGVGGEEVGGRDADVVTFPVLSKLYGGIY